MFLGGEAAGKVGNSRFPEKVRRGKTTPNVWCRSWVTVWKSREGDQAEEVRGLHGRGRGRRKWDREGIPTEVLSR